MRLDQVCVCERLLLCFLAGRALSKPHCEHMLLHPLQGQALFELNQSLGKPGCSEPHLWKHAFNAVTSVSDFVIEQSLRVSQHDTM